MAQKTRSALLTELTTLFPDNNTQFITPAKLREGLTNLIDSGYIVLTDDSNDVTEGTQLFFTDSRVYTKVKAILAAGTNVTLTSNDGAQTITIDAASSGVSDGDKGDVTVSGSGTVWTINSEAVTFNKVENIPTNRVLGRASSGNGEIEALTLPNFRTLINVEDGADVTDTANVTAAGALMDSELASLSGVKTLIIPDNVTITAFAATLLDDIDADTARATLVAATNDQTESTAVFVETVADGTKEIILNSPYEFTITSVTTKSSTGTCTLGVTINGTPLGGSTNAVSTSEVTEAHASDNVVTAGDDVALVVSGNSSCENMAIMIAGTRTLA